jgi:hypothetical protein
MSLASRFWVWKTSRQTQPEAAHSPSSVQTRNTRPRPTTHGLGRSERRPPSPAVGRLPSALSLPPPFSGGPMPCSSKELAKQVRRLVPSTSRTTPPPAVLAFSPGGPGAPGAVPGGGWRHGVPPTVPTSKGRREKKNDESDVHLPQR